MTNFCFQAGCRRRRLNLALFFGSILCRSIFCYGCMFAFVVVCLSFSVLSQEIVWEERLQNDLFCVNWDVKHNSISCDLSMWWQGYPCRYGVVEVHSLFHSFNGRVCCAIFRWVCYSTFDTVSLVTGSEKPSATCKVPFNPGLTVRKIL